MLAAGPLGLAQPLRLHPENNRYLQFRGETVVLMASTEHYGALVNLDFDYIRYLDEVRACGLNYVRVFGGTYREIPGSFGIVDNTLAPEPGRFIAPWLRTSTPGANDGGNKFDLSQWNPAFFHRVRDFVQKASERGIVVEMTVFCPHYDDSLWNASPMNAVNHINGVGAGPRADVHQVQSDLLPFQKALVRKYAEELRNFDNILFEPINEPYNMTPPVPDAWQAVMIDEWAAAEASLPPEQRHLIAQNIANRQGVISNPNPKVSIFHFHYALAEAALANQGLNRVIGHDETGSFFIPANQSAWDFPYRREGWEFLLSGGGLFNHLDYSFTASREDGFASPSVPDSTGKVSPGGGGPSIRRQLGILRWFMESLPLTQCSPQTSFIAGSLPNGVTVRVLGSAGNAYGLYVQGGAISTLNINLPPGTYRGRWIDPRSGVATQAVAEFSHVSGTYALAVPPYGEDHALLLFGGSNPPPEVAITSPIYQTVGAASAGLTLTAEASVANGTLAAVEFLEGETVLGSDDSAPYSLTLGNLSKGSKVFRARAIATDGRKALSPPVKCTLVGDFQVGVNLNGGEVVSNNQTWMAEQDALAIAPTPMQVVNAAATSTSPTLKVYPTPDVATQTLVGSQLLRANQTNNSALSISYPLANGTYDVFFTLIEGQTGFSRDVRATIEGNVVARAIGNLALGEWVNYGPYRTTVSDGVLNMDFTRETATKTGAPKVAKFAVYQAESAVLPENSQLNTRQAPGVMILSWSSHIPPGNLETSTDLGETIAWEPTVLPVVDFSDTYEVHAPTLEPRRFFRLRVD